MVERTTSGTPTGQPRVQKIYTPGINGDWTPSWEWEAAVDAYHKGTTTSRQDTILNSGHITAP